MLCIKCKKNPVFIKKRSLCVSCYQKEYRKRTTEMKKSHFSCTELDFIKNFFTHNNWTFQPAIFRLEQDRYTPDFYDGERNVFIEVSGTRQAYHQNKTKYELFKRLYPKINFEVRNTDGNIRGQENNNFPE